MRLTMKKYIAMFLAVFGFSITAVAQSVVSVIWPYSISVTDVQVIQRLIDTANNQQNRYRFIFLNKPGAGGTIAANDVLNNPQLSILVNTASMYTRPLLYNDSYDPEQFSMINTLCVNSPIVMFSKRYRSLAETTGKEITVGINAGAVTQVLTKTITKNNTAMQLVEIPYKGTAAAAMDMMGGQIDASVGWLPESKRMDKNTHIIGMTGTNNFGQGQTFGQQGIRGLDTMLNSIYIFSRSNLPESTKKDLSRIFYKAMRDNQVQTACQADYGQTVETPYNQLEHLHHSQMVLWARLTQGMPRQ
jgi:tripartite-type tricarboxylate transporter receptor subunit TctC